MSSHEELAGDIAETREKLGATVEELAYRLDLKARTHDKVEAAREQARTTVHDVGRSVQRGAGPVWEHARQLARRRNVRIAAASGLLLLIVLRRRAR